MPAPGDATAAADSGRHIRVRATFVWGPGPAPVGRPARMRYTKGCLAPEKDTA